MRWLLGLAESSSRAVGCAPKDPAFRADNRWVIGWHTGINGTGHYRDHCEQPDDSVKLVFAISIAGKPGFHPSANSGIPFDGQ